MIYEVEVSEQSESDLRGIFEYIAFKLQSLERYQKYVEVQFKKSSFIQVCRKPPNFSCGECQSVFAVTFKII